MPLPLLLVGLVVSTAFGCSKAEPSVEARRRELLKPPDHAKGLAERREKAKLYDDKGNLIPSEEVVLGIVLPRGLELSRELEDEWYYETRVRFRPLARYFKSRLFTGRIDEYETGALRFVKAVAVEAPNGPRADVWVAPVPNRGGVSYVRIRQLGGVRPTIPTEAESKKQLEARRRLAE